jgi:hypothetical protein
MIDRKKQLERWETLAAVYEDLSGCGDSSCLFKRPRGMATNGGCRCYDHVSAPGPTLARFVTASSARQWLHRVLQIARAVPELVAEVRRLRAGLKLLAIANKYAQDVLDGTENHR